MFCKVLIANRGEIAIRVMRACRELDVGTVAVYSDVDRGALHVRYADEAHYIGRGPSRESYLRQGRIIDVAQKSGADAIHPGYGFLSENAEFAAACENAGLTFIGPPASAIAAMGDKVAARRRMQEAGVPVIPGTEADLKDAEILSQAERVSYPLFIKAAAGGGGKGMRLVESPNEIQHALGAARREAAGAFGDDRVYLEKAVQQAHHVEIQLLADGRGHAIHLGERECSIQRRHQKLIEETPSPVMDEDLRQRMGEVAVRAAEAVGYTNAGTVEFLLDDDRNFYFLEMNTRLQVEHPITESVTGVDIVVEQLRIAAGENLRQTQDEIRMQGWAIECRITAEDPCNDFLPHSGRVTGLVQPSGPGIRVDSSLYEGCEVSAHYDPLLAKLIAWGETRAEAIRRMRRALEEYRIVGISTSIPFHRQVMDTAAFTDGAYDTSFLDAGFTVRRPETSSRHEAAVFAAVLLHHARRQSSTIGLEPSVSEGRPNLWKLAGRREAMGQ